MSENAGDDGDFRPYLKLDSGGVFSNLQLYSLQQAVRHWREIEADVAERDDFAERVKERSAFAVVALGVSLSQLLGQNDPDPPRDRVERPHKILAKLVARHGLDPGLIDRFEKLNGFYDDCRHFGATRDRSKYRAVDLLNLEELRACFETGKDVWLAVLSIAGKEPSRELAALFEDSYFPQMDVFFYDPDEDGQEAAG